MNARRLLEHFRALATWQDPDTTVDRIIIGDPDRDVSQVGVTWMSTFAQVREAAARGLHLLITHEPTFWAHANELATVEDWPADSPKRRLADRKRAFIDEHQLTILRLHDSWDGIPELGIPWAWARHLGLGEAPAAVSRQSFQQRYDIPPTTLDHLARRVAAATAPFGEPAVQVVGPPDRPVSKVGIGTGCYCDITTFLDLGCDVSIVCDDSNWYWEGIQFAADGDHPIIRVNHGVSEEPGMIALARYLTDTFPGLTAHHLPHGSTFRLVGSL
jgi:putative NIF3 family GTP cyclohydrolase 1 type 2